MTDESAEPVGVDFEDEKSTLLAYYTDHIYHGIQLPPRLQLYSETEPIVKVTSRPFGIDSEDRIRAIFEMLYFIPCVRPHSCLLTFEEPVHTTKGLERSLLTIMFSQTGALVEVFPIINNDGAISYDMSAEINPDEPIYPAEISHIMPMFTRIERSPFSATEIHDFLASKGHGVELAENYERDKINLRAGV